MNRATRFSIFSFGFKQPQPNFPDDKEVSLFNKLPVLYRGFTPKSVQDSINELQERLHTQGLLTNVSGKFDFETEEAVKEFQKKNNLRVDGIVGPLSWACLFYPQLSRNHRITPPELQDAVKELQTILHQEGFSQKEPDGYFDRDTERAVKHFQRAYGLKDDGLVGAATWTMLLGMRQKIDKRFPRLIYSVSPQFLFFWEQFLMISCIIVGIYHSPIPGPTPVLNTALATAYGLTCIVPFLLEYLPLKPASKPRLPMLQYAPYVLTGIFWKPIINYLGTLLVK